MGTAVSKHPGDLGKKQTKREWIYAKKPGGQMYNYRQWVGYSLLLFFFIAPFIRIKGNPFLLFNIIERKFSIFGNLFYPQDLYIAVFGMLIVMVCVVLFTVVYGRIWCGWTCPQTIFMELVFRRIEYWIEGDWTQQRKLNEGPNTDARAWKKLFKHTVFFLIAFIISNLFLSYVIGVEALYQIMTDPVEAHLGGFISILIFAGVFYGVFAHVREIVCTTICPYGRLQGVLLDDNSITVAYDSNRGEPRGKLKKEEEGVKGDCIDCNLCVHVCPTGIDIRNGLQMECVSCTACIDACDAVMEKINKPKRLIGFYPMGEIEKTEGFKKSNTRAIAYSFVLLALIGVFITMIFSRSEIDGRLLRAKGSTYQLLDNGKVSNLYTIELMNKSGREIPFTLQSVDPAFTIQLVNTIDLLHKDKSATLSFFLMKDKNKIEQYKQNIKINITSEGHIIETVKTTFIGPTGLK